MKLSERLKSLLYPPHCCGCDATVTKNDGFLCENCRGLLVHPSADRSRCDICFLPANKCICGENLYYDRIAFLFYNENAQRSSVYRLKFNGRQDLAEGYARNLSSALKERNMTDEIDFVTAIPMSPQAVKKRGYNQSELIARKLAEIINKPYEPILYKCLDGARQHDLDRISRTGNILGAFEPLKEAEEKIPAKTILTVDDIVTGGSTANEAAKTLKIFGADRVFIAAPVVTPKARK